MPDRGKKISIKISLSLSLSLSLTWFMRNDAKLLSSSKSFCLSKFPTNAQIKNPACVFEWQAIPKDASRVIVLSQLNWENGLNANVSNVYNDPSLERRPFSYCCYRYQLRARDSMTHSICLSVSRCVCHASFYSLFFII